MKNGYVYLMKAGSSLQPSWKGSGVIVEGAALVYTGLVSGVAFEIWFSPIIPR